MTSLRNQILKQSIAAEIGSPPDEYDLRTFSYCRSTQRSSENLRSLIVQVRGNWRQFKEALGYNPLSNNSKTGSDDEAYWALLCAWMRMYLPAFEKALKRMSELPSTELVHEQMANALGIDTNFLQYYLANKPSIKTFVNDIRDELGTMAELKLFTLIAQGDPATIRWALPRLNPKVYNLNAKNKDDDDEVMEIEFV